jgi:hypothetical protein
MSAAPDFAVLEPLEVVGGVHENGAMGDFVHPFGGGRKGHVAEAEEGIDGDEILQRPEGRDALAGGGDVLGHGLGARNGGGHFSSSLRRSLLARERW